MATVTASGRVYDDGTAVSGATVKLWLPSAFTTLPTFGTALPGGSPAYGPASTNGSGDWSITGVAEGYYVRSAEYSGTVSYTNVLALATNTLPTVVGARGSVTLDNTGLTILKSPDDSTTYLTLGRLKYYNTEGLSPGSAPQWTTSRALWDYTVPNAEVSASKARANVWLASALGTTGPSIRFELNAERNAGVYSAYAALDKPLVIGYGTLPPGPTATTSSLDVRALDGSSAAEMRLVYAGDTSKLTALSSDSGGVLTIRPSGAALTLDGQGNSTVLKVLYGSNKALTVTVGTSGKAVLADPYGISFSHAVDVQSTLTVTGYATIGQPRVQYTLSADQAIGNGGASDTQLTLTSAVATDSNITVDGSGTFTVGVAGKYRVTAHCYWNVAATGGGTRYLKIVTGAGGLLDYDEQPIPAAGFYGTNRVGDEFDLAAGATVKVVVYQTAGTGQKVAAGAGYTSVTITKLS